MAVTFVAKASALVAYPAVRYRLLAAVGRGFARAIGDAEPA